MYSRSPRSQRSQSQDEEGRGRHYAQNNEMVPYRGYNKYEEPWQDSEQRRELDRSRAFYEGSSRRREYFPQQPPLDGASYSRESDYSSTYTGSSTERRSRSSSPTCSTSTQSSGTVGYEYPPESRGYHDAYYDGASSRVMDPGYYEQRGYHPSDEYYHDEDAYSDDGHSYDSSSDVEPYGEYFDRHLDRQYYDGDGSESGNTNDSQTEYEGDGVYGNYREYRGYEDDDYSDGDGYYSDGDSYYDSDY